MANLKMTDLKVDRNLLDTNFEGYKLSLDPLPMQTIKLPSSIHRCRTSDSQWSFLHVRIFANHNDLIHDRWNSVVSAFFCVLSDGTLCQLTLSKDDKRCELVTPVFNIPFPQDFSNRGDKYNATVSLSSSKVAVLSNGCGSLWLCDRQCSPTWKVLYSSCDICGGAAFIVLDSITKSEDKIVDCLLELVEEQSKIEFKPSHVSSLIWITLQTENGTDWCLKRTKKLETAGIVEYAALSKEISTVCIVSSKSVSFVSDSEKPVISQQLETVIPQNLEWNKGDSENIEPLPEDESQLELMPAASDLDDKMELTEPSANPEQLEECDSASDEDLFLTWFDGETHEVLFQADLSGHQWLFSVAMNPTDLPYVCLRHDVDGILWRVPNNPSTTDQPCGSHFATFNAFGYVQAGKASRKFSTCASDCSYSIIADCRKHAYIYRSQKVLETSLRNRKTGREVSRISKQQLISLNGNEDIVGLSALPQAVLLLTETDVHVVYMGDVNEIIIDR